MPSVREALDSPDPLRVELAMDGMTPRLGPLIGMRTAVWIPVRARDRTLGLAMVAHTRPPGQLDLVELRARADEIALAIQHHRNSRRAANWEPRN